MKTRRGFHYEEETVPSTQYPPRVYLAWHVEHGGERMMGPESIIYWQNGTIPEVGRMGFQPEDLLELVAERLRLLNDAFPARENSLAITNIEDAILWLNERTRDREARGVEGQHRS